MLHINDLTYRIEGRPIFDGATAGIPEGHKVGLVGRNGAGKTTLLRLINGEIAPDDGSVSWPKSTRLGYVAQEAPGGDDTLVDWVLSNDLERASLLAEADTATDPERIGDIHMRLNDMGAHAAPARVAQILSGLGFDEEAQKRTCKEFSGGWRMRLALGAVLFLEPELLLLDEPTNYLDLEGTMWLEAYLKSYPHTVLIVSHDRNLLNRSVGFILHLDKGKLTLYTGGYDDFEETRREKQRLEGKMKQKQDAERAHIQSFIDRFKAKASKAKQAQSRVKALARMKPIAEQTADHVTPFKFPKAAKPLASPLLRIENCVAGYSPDVPILQNLNLRIDHDDRIALLGQNGNGKSTFAKLLAGKLEPLAGNMFGGKKIDVGYFAQHQLDEVRADKTPYDYINDLMPEATEAQKRSKLAQYGFGHEKMSTKSDNLSGGEKARLLFMLTAYHGPHLLILDEPTNHLDVDSREALIQALNEFEGAVILISHDRHLVEASADRLWIVKNGTVTDYDGDMDSYRDLLLAERGKARAGKASAAAVEKVDRSEQRRTAASRRSELAPLRKAVQAAEKQMEQYAKDIKKLDAQLADSGLYSRDPAKAKKLSIERGLISKFMGEAEEAWLKATDAHEQAASEMAGV